MFGLFKKKEVMKEEPVLSNEATEQIRVEIDQLNEKIAVTQKPQELAQLFEQLGLKFADLNETDQAITALEHSLENQKSIGDGYKKLMHLYNKKRAESARAGDDQGIDYYMGKMDEMRQIAKQVTISGSN
jgi:vacuolar-type H+-ATPase subunit I/STV1